MADLGRKDSGAGVDASEDLRNSDLALRKSTVEFSLETLTGGGIGYDRCKFKLSYPCSVRTMINLIVFTPTSSYW